MNTDTIRSQFEKRTDDLRTVFQDTVTDLRDRREAISRQGEERLDAAKDRIRTAEVEGLTGALSLLGRARTRLGDRVTVLKKGEDALSELLVTLRAGRAVTLPVEDFDVLSIKRTLPLLEGLNSTDLRVLRMYELAHKNRVTLIRELDDRIAALGEEIVAG